jgi:hypothetical protein
MLSEQPLEFELDLGSKKREAKLEQPTRNGPAARQQELVSDTPAKRAQNEGRQLRKRRPMQTLRNRRYQVPLTNRLWRANIEYSVGVALRDQKMHSPGGIFHIDPRPPLLAAGESPTKPTANRSEQLIPSLGFLSKRHPQTSYQHTKTAPP